MQRRPRIGGWSRSRDTRRHRIILAFGFVSKRLDCLDHFVRRLAGDIVFLILARLLTLAKRLNDEGHTTRRGRAWNAVQVRRILSAFLESESVPGLTAALYTATVWPRATYAVRSVQQ
jgi:hypothetical protein